jgi:cytochrome c biogenesis protein CcmG, thiol:disulfide interchange protein DsbE
MGYAHALAAVTLLIAAPATAREARVGEPAPDFELTLIDKSKVRLSDLKGQVVVLNFWATWCVPCRTELPLLDRYYELRKARGLAMYAIATEDSLPLFKLKPLFEKMKMPSARRLRGSYSVKGGLPTNYVIDRAGIVRYAKAGAFGLDSLNAVLVPLLDQRPPT